MEHPNNEIHNLKQTLNNISTDSWELHLHSSLHKAQREGRSNVW